MPQTPRSGDDVTALMGGGAPDPSQWGTRADGSAKGDGFLGPMKRPDGKVSSEISIGVNIDGKEVEIPTMVPTLSPSERQWLLTNDISDPSKIPMSIQQKAVDFAKPRIAAGKSPFASADESPRASPTSGQDVTALMMRGGPQPVAAGEPDTYWGGAVKGAVEGVVGGATGFVKGLTDSPGNFVRGVGGLLTTNPITTVTNAAAGIARIPAAMRASAADPEGWGRAVGDQTGQQLIGMVAPGAVGAAGRGVGAAGRGAVAAGKLVGPEAAAQIVKYGSTAIGAHAGGPVGAIAGAQIGEELASRIRARLAPAETPAVSSGGTPRLVGKAPTLTDTLTAIVDELRAPPAEAPPVATPIGAAPGGAQAAIDTMRGLADRPPTPPATPPAGPLRLVPKPPRVAMTEIHEAAKAAAIPLTEAERTAGAAVVRQGAAAADVLDAITTLKASPALAGLPGAPAVAVAPRLFNELAIAARRAKVTLTGADYTAGVAQMQAGQTATEAVAGLRRSAPAIAEVPAAIAAKPVALIQEAAAAKLKLTGAEMAQGLKWQRAGIAADVIMQRIQSSRAMTDQLGMPTPTEAAALMRARGYKS